MKAGRPKNSKTPVWRSFAAIRIRAYRYVTGEHGTKYGCARFTGLSRTTVIKWWDTVEWTPESTKNFDYVCNEWIEFVICDRYKNLSYKRLADRILLPLDLVNYEMWTHELINPYLNKLANLPMYPAMYPDIDDLYFWDDNFC